MRSLDKLGEAELVRKRQVSGDKSKYSWTPIVKTSDDKNGKKYFDSFKAKFDIFFDGKKDGKDGKDDVKSRKVDTAVFVREGGKPVQKDIKTVTDVASYLTYNCTARFVFLISKMWYQKSGPGGIKLSGITIKCIQLEVTVPSESMSAKNALRNTCAFSDEPEQDARPVVKQPKSESSDKDTKADVKKDMKAEAKADPKADTKADTKGDTKTAAPAQQGDKKGKGDGKADGKTDGKADGKDKKGAKSNKSDSDDDNVEEEDDDDDAPRDRKAKKSPARKANKN